jgi:hypothetical protein
VSPKLSVSTEAPIKYAEFSGIVTVGNPETARKLTERLGHEVKIGDKIDMGKLAVYYPNSLKSWWENFKISRSKFVRALR